MSGIFLGGDYSFYPYDYLIGEIGNNLGTPEATITGFKNLVIGYYKGSMDEFTPHTLIGAFDYYGGSFEVSTPFLKLSAGVNGQISKTTAWDIYEIGVSASFGFDTGLPVSGQFRSNVLTNKLLNSDGAGTGQWLINRNVIPTSERSLFNKLSAPFLKPGFR